MTGGAAERPGFDPRFDPRFQPGYDPVTDAAAPPPLEVRPAVADPVVGSNVEPAPPVEGECAPVSAAGPSVRPRSVSRAKPWILAGLVVAVAAILLGGMLVWSAAAGVRVIQPTGTVDQGVMVQVASHPLVPSLIEAGVVALVALLALHGILRARASPTGGRGVAAVRSALRDRSVIALAVVAVLGIALATWSATWRADPVGDVSYFGAQTYDDLSPLRVQVLAAAAAGAATIAAVGGCLGIVIVVATRLRVR